MNIREKNFEGSMTVEASFVLPLFLFFFVNVMTLFSITEVQSQLEGALHQAGSELSLRAFDLVYGEELVAGEESASVEALAGAAGVFTAREYLRKDIGERIDRSVVSGGFEGLSFLQSKVMLGGDIIDLVVDYHVHPMIPLIGFKDIPVEGRYYGHAWTGYDITEGFDHTEHEEEMVYVTEHGEVYHRDIDCVHLRIRVESVDFAKISLLRSKDGKKYYPCEYCGSGGGAGNVFITGYGEKYHSRITCPGLKRSIYTIPISEVGGRRPCSACG